ncbi:hypothetical protein PFISCL1PPCAC_4391, partial [Pristionchus fissidentatus]
SDRSMISVSSQDSIFLARAYATELIEHCSKRESSYLLDYILSVLSRITLDALDCALTGQPFRSDSLVSFKDDMVGLSGKSNVAKFAFAYSILMNEMSGSIIGTTNIGTTATIDPMPPWDMGGAIKEEEPEAPDLSGSQLIDTNCVDTMLASSVKTDSEPEELPLGLVKSEIPAITPSHFTVLDEPVSMKQEKLPLGLVKSEYSAGPCSTEKSVRDAG